MADKNNRKMSVLVVDDDPFLRDVLQRFLARNNYVVAVAENADEAMGYAREIPFEIAIVDIFIHGMDGIKLADELKKNNPSIIIIIMTGHPSLDTALTALKQGVHDYLIKPFALDQLEESINRCLREQEIVKENSYLKDRIDELEQKVKEYEQILSQTHVIHKHSVTELKKQRAKGDAVYRDQSSKSLQERMQRLYELREQGVISEDEYSLRVKKLTNK